MIVPFRATLPNATSAANYVAVALQPQKKRISKFILWGVDPATGNHTPTATVGWRLLASGRLIVPAQGGMDNSVISNPQEAMWAPLPDQPMYFDFRYFEIDGPPFNLEFRFYNTSAVTYHIGGMLLLT